MGPTGINMVTLRSLLDPLNAANVKKHYEWDADGDPTYVYYAQAEAQDGDNCIRKVYEYDTVSGVKNVSKTSWETENWQSAWD